MDRKKFFDSVRASLFDGGMNQDQVSGMSAVLDEWDRRKLTDLHWLAYMLATIKHETAHTMQPIAEYGHGRGRTYGRPAANGKVYYGRGFVQLTWQRNYAAMGKILHVDLVGNPELALDLKIATGVLYEGMLRGTFTGKKLADYFSASHNDPVNARKIINRLDRAGPIAALHNKFLAALRLASVPAAAPAVATPEKEKQHDVG